MLSLVCQQCDQLVQEYEPMLVQMILQTLDPDFVCLVGIVLFFTMLCRSGKFGLGQLSSVCVCARVNSKLAPVRRLCAD